MSHLAAEIMPGYSACCGAWLGSEQKAHNDDGDEFEMYVTATIAELLQSSHVTQGAGNDAPFSRDKFIANLNKCIKVLSGGVAFVFAEATGMSYQTVIGWLRKDVRPSFESILRLTFALGQTAHKFLFRQKCPMLASNIWFQ